jgi:NosR/NirI family nitrous oxide reductase transcriptional regulator
LKTKQGLKYGELRWAAAFFVLLVCLFGGRPAKAESRLPEFLNTIPLGEVFPGAERLGPVSGTPPAAPAFDGQKLLGYVYLNSDVVNSAGYSGKPISIAVGISLDGKIAGAKLVEHHEPIVLIGIPQGKIENFLNGYVGLNYADAPTALRRGPPVDIVSGATVTTMVIGDSITRSAIRIAQSRGLGGAKAEPAAAATVTKTIDQSAPTESWAALLGDGSVRRFNLSIGDINKAFEQSGNQDAIAHPEPGSPDDTFIDLYAALVSVSAIGRSLLGEAGYQRLQQSLKPGQQAIVIAANGRYSFKGSGYVRGGIFDRIEVLQGENTIRFRDRNYERLGGLAADGAPRFNEIGLFLVPEGTVLDPTEPWRVQLLVQRAMGAREKAFLTFDLDYSLPAKYVKVEKHAAPPAATLATPQAQAAPVSA